MSAEYCRDKIKCWTCLLAAVAVHLKDGRKYCAAPSIRGSSYKPRGIAIIGRAPNGWVREYTKEALCDREERVCRVAEILSVRVCRDDPKMIGDTSKCEPMHWVQHKYCYKGRKRSNVELGRFWPAVSEVVKAHSELENGVGWEETIAWANLYPLSFESGNPSPKLAEAQRTASAQLLTLDLRKWQPGAALFITEVNSKEDNPKRRGSLELCELLGYSYPFFNTLGIADPQVTRIDAGPILARAPFGDQGTCLLFAVRPDARHCNRREWANAVTEALRQGC